jgi:Inner membrane protein YgaP-like, transmembrane domain
VRKHAIVFVDVESDQATDRTDAVQRVEEEPLMFEGAPPCFDHGVRELQFREGQNPAQHARGDHGGFGAASVLLGINVESNYLWFTSFVGLNLFQSAFTQWCPMMTILRKAEVLG